MKQAQMERWRLDRARGMRHYVLVKGVLAYGLAMFVAMTLLRYREMTLPRIGINAITWMVGGLIFGLAMWHIQEHQYRKDGGGNDSNAGP